MTLRLLLILKQNGIAQPAGFKVDQNPVSGLKEDKGENAIFDINEMSENGEMNGDLNFDEDKENMDEGVCGAATGEQKVSLSELYKEQLMQNERLEEQVVKLNMEVREKNEKLLELLEELEEVRIQVYARDKSVSLQQKQIEDLLEELREAKSVENDVKILVGKKIAIEEENARLRKEIDAKFLNATERQYEQSELNLQNKTLTDQVTFLTRSLDEYKQQSINERKKLEAEKTSLATQLTTAKSLLDAAKKDLTSAQKQAVDASEKLTSVNG